ncbi:MAG: helix-turn-helix domain-containing protein [candidate division KSB1 bacterium]
MSVRTMPHTLPNGEEPRCPCGQQYYRLAKVARLFDLSEKTLRRMITNHQIKAKRIGGSIRIPHEELAKIVRDY